MADDPQKAKEKAVREAVPGSSPDALVFTGPGMRQVLFSDLLANAGIVTGVAEWQQETDGKLASLQQQVDVARAELQRQIDELRGVTPIPLGGAKQTSPPPKR